MACNGEPPAKVTPPVLKVFYRPPPSSQTFYSPLQLEMAASAFVHVHISEAIITD